MNNARNKTNLEGSQVSSSVASTLGAELLLKESSSTSSVTK